MLEKISLKSMVYRVVLPMMILPLVIATVLSGVTTWRNAMFTNSQWVETLKPNYRLRARALAEMAEIRLENAIQSSRALPYPIRPTEIFVGLRGSGEVAILKKGRDAPAIPATALQTLAQQATVSDFYRAENWIFYVSAKTSSVVPGFIRHALIYPITHDFLDDLTTASEMGLVLDGNYIATTLKGENGEYLLPTFDAATKARLIDPKTNGKFFSGASTYHVPGLKVFLKMPIRGPNVDMVHAFEPIINRKGETIGHVAMMVAEIIMLYVPVKTILSSVGIILILSIFMFLFMRHTQQKLILPLASAIERVNGLGRSLIRKAAETSNNGFSVPESTDSGVQEKNEISQLNLSLLNLERVIDETAALEKTLTEERTKSIHSAKMATLGEMAAGMAHEINNPLAVIHTVAGQAKELLQDDPIDRVVVSNMLDRVEVTSSRIARIVSGLRTFSRDGSNDPFQDVALKTLIDDTLAFCMERFKQHGITMKVNDIDAATRIECRATQISQVLLNLLNNAHDAIAMIKPGQPKWISVQVHATDRQIEIEVSDSGPGIPAEIQQKIFQPFFTTKEVGKGTGLGLSLSKGILESHRGKIELKAGSPHTCFLIHLPKVQPKNDSGKVA